jgi:ribosomal protein S18 acetylase RimI-like enzyme
MNNILIRQANLKDLESIQKLNHELFVLEKQNFDSTLVTDWPLSQEGKKYFEELIQKEYVIVATDNSHIIGYLAGSINEKYSYSNVQYGEINNMFVDGKYRGQGIGKALINEFKKYCCEHNIRNLKVVASAKNKNACNFYQKYGFDEFDITLTMSID